MKELEKEFTGRGETKGFRFTRLASNDKAYLYEVLTGEGSIHYEVFERKENTQYDCVSYPSSKAFGIWAWTCKTLDRANILFDHLSNIIYDQTKKIPRP